MLESEKRVLERGSGYIHSASPTADLLRSLPKLDYYGDRVSKPGESGSLAEEKR